MKGKNLLWVLGLGIVVMAIGLVGGCSQGPGTPGSIDQTTPVINISSPVTNIKVNTSMINIQGTIDDNSIAATCLILNGAPQNIDVNSGSFNASINLIKGSNTVKVSATNSSGNTGISEEILIIYDPDAPLVRITSPTNGLITNNSTISILGDVDDSSISTTAIIINGDESNITIVSGTFNKTITLLSSSNIIEVKAIDSAGNIGRSGEYKIILDNMVTFV